MPLPHLIARANRRSINRLAGRFAGKLPPFAMLLHVGRVSGEAYSTPIMAFRRGEGFVICLTYGDRTDWLRNLRAAGSAELVWQGQRFTLSEPRVAHGSPFTQPLAKPIQAALWLMQVRDFLHIRGFTTGKGPLSVRSGPFQRSA